MRKLNLRRLVPQKTAHRVWVATLALLLLSSSVLPVVLNMGHANALTNFVQSDWSGGVGTDVYANQYSSAVNVNPSASGVAIGGDSQHAWCATGNCDSNWVFRRKLMVVNNDPQRTDFQVKFTVIPQEQMASDFRDLRFTNEAGDQDLPYYILSKSDNIIADVVVKVPTLEEGENNIYMYYGNGSALSLSSANDTMDFSDHFADYAGNEASTPYWSTCGGATFDSDGVAHLPQGCGLNTRDGYDHQDNSIDRVSEYEISKDLSGVTDCSGYTGANYEKLTNDITQGDPDSFFTGNNVAQSSGCAEKRWGISQIGITHQYGYRTVEYNTENRQLFESNQFYRFRLVNRASGGVSFYFSLDGGGTYIEYPTFPNNNLQQTTKFLFTTDQLPESVRNVYTYKTGNYTVTPQVYEHYGGRTGYITSPIIDMGDSPYFGKVLMAILGTQDNGNAVVRIQTSNDSDMGNEQGLEYCNYINSDIDISNSDCVSAGQRYLRYQIIIIDSGTNTAGVSSITLEHDNDNVAPDAPGGLVAKRSQSGTILADNAWMPGGISPYFSWNASDDNSGGSGVLGYCMYFGTDSNADTTAAGLIVGPNALNTNGICEQAVSGTNFNATGNLINTSSLTTGETYYFRVRAFDRTGNLSAVTQTRVRYDNIHPESMTLLTVPSAVNSPVFKVSWVGGLGNDPFIDTGSGVAGLKYCVTTVLSGFSGCGENDSNWFGPNHGSGSISDTSDVFPMAANELTTSQLDADRLDDVILGYNAIAIAVIDNAGNYGILGNSVPIIFQYSHVASSEPSNLQVSPSSNTANNFAFTWGVPATLYGDRTEAEFCWTVNTPIASGGTNCNWTGKNIYALAAGPYATQQGVNTLYVATKDVTGNFDNTKYASINFTTSTIAPGVPHDLDVSDVSIRATSTWKLALSWTGPDQVAAGVDHYKVLRSTDDSNYVEVGSTSGSNTSFIDAGLNQETYYYKISACDDANSCGIPSASASRRPTGRFTEPAKLTADTDQPKIIDVTTRKATIKWYTDRESDSRVALGKSSGKYFSEEIGNSTQTANHYINLTNLEPGTTYYFVSKWTDGDGNTGQSVEHTFTTLPAPAISEVQVSQLSISSALVTFKTKQASKLSLYYGKSESYGDVTTIDTSEDESTYSIQLTGLSDGTKYFFKLNGFDVDGNEYQGNIYSLTTPARPIISNLNIGTVDGEPSSTKKVTWTTNVPTNSTVSYIPRGGVELNAADSALTTEHSMIIKGLLDDTDYDLVARSVDAAGNRATSDTRSFHTALDTRPPKISDLVIETATRGNGGDAKGQVVVSWKTDEPATSQLAYGQGDGSNFTSKTPVDERLTLEHTMIISDLSTSSIYRIQAVSADKGGNSAVSSTETAIIGRPSDNVFTIIISALQKVFGVKSS